MPTVIVVVVVVVVVIVVVIAAAALQVMKEVMKMKGPVRRRSRMKQDEEECV